MIRRVRDEDAHKRMKAEAYINKHGGTSVLNKKNSEMGFKNGPEIPNQLFKERHSSLPSFEMSKQLKKNGLRDNANMILRGNSQMDSGKMPTQKLSRVPSQNPDYSGTENLPVNALLQ